MTAWFFLIAVLSCVFGILVTNKAGKSTYRYKMVVQCIAGGVAFLALWLLSFIPALTGAGVLGTLMLPFVAGAAAFFGSYARYRTWYR